MVCQVAGGIKAAHSKGLAVRVIDPSKILLTGKNRIRINAVGVLDMLMYSTTPTGDVDSQNMQQDLLNFGQVVVIFGCGNLASISTSQIPKSLEHIQKSYSVEAKNLVLYLLSKPTAFKSIDDVLTLISPRLIDEIHAAHSYSDTLEHNLGGELENGRIVRLMCKLGFINERPEYGASAGGDTQWSETGDRYIIKLFRDHVFHQVDEEGRAVVDMAHVIYNLNKLDAFCDDRIMLMSRDEQSCLIVSYREVANCVASAYNELVVKR